MYVESAIKCVFEHCKALNCLEGGFEQIYCKFNVFDSCFALEIKNDDPEKHAAGFVSVFGESNLFKECLASGIGIEGENPNAKNTYGFLINDVSTEVISSIVNKITGLGVGYAYGIKVDCSYIGDLCLGASIDYETGSKEEPFSVAWSPCGQYVAVGGEESSGAEVYIFALDASGSTLSLVAKQDMAETEVVNTVAWSPDGQYLAVGSSSDTVGTQEVHVFKFDADSSMLTLKDSQEHGLDSDVYSVDWSPDGRYLAVGGQTPGAASPDRAEIRIFAFENESLLLTAIAEHGLGDDEVVKSVAWSPDGSYLAVGGKTPITPVIAGDKAEIRVFKFANENLLLTVTAEHGSDNDELVNSVDWSPDGRYLAVGGKTPVIGDGKEIRIFAFENENLILTAVAQHGTDSDEVVNSVSWSPHCNFLLVGGATPDSDEKEIRVFSFDGTDLSLVDTAEYNLDSDDRVNAVAWSSNGQYFAGVGYTVGENNALDVFTFVSARQNIIKNNEITKVFGGQEAFGVYADGTRNFIAKNIGYDNGINFSNGIENVYAAPRNLVNAQPNSLDNISIPSADSCVELDTCCQTIISKVEDLNEKVALNSSKLDWIITNWPP